MFKDCSNYLGYQCVSVYEFQKISKNFICIHIDGVKFSYLEHNNQELISQLYQRYIKHHNNESVGIDEKHDKESRKVSPSVASSVGGDGNESDGDESDDDDDDIDESAASDDGDSDSNDNSEHGEDGDSDDDYDDEDEEKFASRKTDIEVASIAYDEESCVCTLGEDCVYARLPVKPPIGESRHHCSICSKKISGMCLTDDQQTNNALVICRFCSNAGDLQNISSVTDEGTSSASVSTTESKKSTFVEETRPYVLKRDHDVKDHTTAFPHKRYYNVGTFAVDANGKNVIKVSSMSYVALKGYKSSPNRFIFMGSIGYYHKLP